MRIFACAGSRPYQFNRLFEELDRLVASGGVVGEVFAQIGASDYEPRSFPFEHFMDPDDFRAAEERADIVISHGASGSIMGALNAGKRVIAVARLAKYGEHINDHQVAINKTLAAEGLVISVIDIADLGGAIRALQSGGVELRPWRNDNPGAIVDAIDEFIQEKVL